MAQVARPLFVFAPGAGAASTSPWMQRFAAALEDVGAVQRFDYPYRLAGRKLPDPLPRLVQAHAAVLAEARAAHVGPVVLIGKSMGGRVGCHVSLEQPVDGLVCLGYPLRSPGKRAATRSLVLQQLTTPLLLVQGTRDELCPLELLAEVRPTLSTRNELYIVQGGDHSLEVSRAELKRTSRTQAEVEAQIVARIAQFVASL